MTHGQGDCVIDDYSFFIKRCRHIWENRNRQGRSMPTTINTRSRGYDHLGHDRKLQGHLHAFWKLIQSIKKIRIDVSVDGHGDEVSTFFHPSTAATDKSFGQFILIYTENNDCVLDRRTVLVHRRPLLHAQRRRSMVNLSLYWWLIKVRNSIHFSFRLCIIHSMMFGWLVAHR